MDQMWTRASGLGREAVQVDLLPQPAAEGLHGPGTDPYRLGCWGEQGVQFASSWLLIVVRR
jgi:hypothetical protein